MADTLTDVIKQLKIGRQQDQFLAENRKVQNDEVVKELASLKKLFGAFFAQQKPDGDDLEEKREKREKKSKQQKASNGPNNFKDGFFQGTGLAGILGKVKDLASSALTPFAGALGGASLGGLFGRVIGKSFMGVIGFYLGAKYLDKLVDPIVDKITGDDATVDTMFGEIDISKIVSGIGGALGLIFGPRLIGAMIGSYFTDIGGKEGGAKFRLMFLRRLGLAGLILTAASFSGDWLQVLGVGEGLSGAVSMSMTAAGIGLMLLGGKGLIIGAIVGFAIGAVRGLFNYLNDRGREAEDIVVKNIKENTNEIFDDLANNRINEAEKKAKEIRANMRMIQSNMAGGTTYMDFLSERGIKFRDEATLAMEAAAIKSGNDGLRSAANAERADLIGDNAANVSNDDLMAEMVRATQGMRQKELDTYLGGLMTEVSSGFAANQDQARLVSFVADNFEHLSKTLGDKSFDASVGMGARERGIESHTIGVIENNTGVMDKLNFVLDRMIDQHEVTNNSLIGRLFGTSADKQIPMEAKGVGATPTVSGVDARNQSSNNTSSFTNVYTRLASQDRGLNDGI